MDDTESATVGESKNTTSRVPQLVMLSENECPNSGPDSIVGSDCTTGALTMWGYCGRCWTHPETYVPKDWRERVDALLDERNERA